MKSNIIKPLPPPGGTEVSRAIVEAREKTGLSQDELAKTIPVARRLLEDFESGLTAPTIAMLSRLSLALGCEDLAVRFPYVTPTDPEERAKPENLAVRLQHLVNLVAEGKQTRFSREAGLSDSTMSKLMRSERGLTPDSEERILAYLPNLSKSWLYTGAGEPFLAAEVPQAQVPEVEPEKQSIEDVNQGTGSMQAIRVMPNAVVPERSFTEDEHGRQIMSIGGIVEFLEEMAENNCGITPQQVKELLAHFE